MNEMTFRYVCSGLMGWLFIGTLSLAAPKSGQDPLPATAKPIWRYDQAAHLLRRAGFSGTPEQIDHLVRLGRDEAVDLLLNRDRQVESDVGYPEEAFDQKLPRPLLKDLPATRQRELRQLTNRIDQFNRRGIQEWWLRRMIVTSDPLEEKMTLFWHGWFTSGLREVQRPELIYRQNLLLRTHALGRFGDLLKAISRDPAMLVYLDNARNIKNKPNENFARELLELFTMGEGHYSEQDVREIARAFTGWSVQPASGKFLFRSRQHDDGTKTIFGQSGRYDGDEVLDLILAQPATANYLARELWAFFVEPDPSDEMVAALAVRLRESDYDLREALRVILCSDAFYRAEARFSLVKSPVELVVGTCRVLEAPPGHLRQMVQQMNRMGQELFQPPNVKGWDGGHDWISTSRLFARYNGISTLLYGAKSAPVDPQAQRRRQMRQEWLKDKELSPELRKWLNELKFPPAMSQTQPPYEPMVVLQRYGLNSPAAIVDHYVMRLLQSPIAPERRAVLIQVLQGPKNDFQPGRKDMAERVRTMIHLICSMPEYQLY